MAGQSGSARFHALFESALQVYERKTGITLAQHPLAADLQNCHSIDDITTLLQGRAQVFGDLRERDRMMEAIKATVSILTPLADATSSSLADSVGLTSFPPVKAIHTGLGILLDAANGVISSCDVLADLLESIQHFVTRLKVYTEISRTPAIDKIVVNLIVELISTLALVTRKLKQRRFLKLVKNFFAVKDIKEAQQRLDRLIQGEAAATAAQILEVIRGQARAKNTTFLQVDDGNASTDSVPKVSDQPTSDVTRNKSKRDKLRRDIQKWLSPPDPWKNYNMACKMRHGESGVWFIRGATFSEWKESGQNSLLWIHGKPGSGKSIMCSTIIEDIENMHKAGRASLAMHFYDFREDQKKDLRGLLSSVIFQLCDQSDSYYNILSTFHSAHRDGAQSPSDGDLTQCLKDLLKIPGPQPVYLIIDGLDECPSTSALSSPREEVLSLLEDLIQAQFRNLRICVTSRSEVDIKAVLEPLTFRSISLHDESGQMEDIENYIRSVVNMNRKMQRWKPKDKQLVIDILTERADGTFRWVYCQLEYLADCLPGRIRHALGELPDTLDGTYERTLREIKDTNWEFAQRLLLCVSVVSRPLRIEELAEFLAFDFKAGPIPKFRDDWRLEDPAEAVLSTCSTLLVLVNVDDTQVVQFSHFSVREFLTSARFAEKGDTISFRYHISMTPAHTLLAQACLGVLLHLDKNVTRGSLTKIPLAEYAAEHWVEHARFEGVSQKADKGIKKLFDRRKHYLSVWLWIYDPTAPSWMRDKSAKVPSPPRATPLHYAAFCGLHDVVEALAIEHPQDVNSQVFDNESTPLYLASREGHVEVVRLLLKYGADLAAQTKDGWTPLHRAPDKGNVKLAQLLLERGADAAAQTKDGWTPLHRASDRGDMEIARLLLEHGADAAAKTKDGWTPLHRASDRGDLRLSRLLFEHGANAAARTKDNKTPLHLASFSSHVRLARFLLENGADVAAQDQYGRTPLHEASHRGHVEVARLLLEHGADAAAQDRYERTPLHRASPSGYVELARLLLEHGADAAAQDADGRSPLHEASYMGHMELARFLLEHGADTATRTMDGRTPLHEASYMGHMDLARLLLEHGADAATEDEDGQAPHHLASESGHVELARLLVAALAIPPDQTFKHVPS